MNDTFLHNFADAVVVETAWRTAISVAEDTLAEERVGLADRPVRTLSFRWTGMTRDEGNRMLIALAKGSGEAGGLVLPFYRDQARTAAESSGTTINCPTTDRNFAVGRQIVIADMTGGRPSNIRVAEIASVGADSIEVAASIVDTYPTGSLVWPLLVAQPVLDPVVTFRSDSLTDLGLVAVEVPEDALPALSTPGDAPADFDTHDDRPIFDIEPDWTSGVGLGLVRDADTFPQGRSQVVEVRGTRPRFRLETTLVFFERDEAFRFLRFFDSRGGRLAPFWLAAPVALWEPSDIGVGFVDVETDADPADADDFFFYVAVVMKDGTVYVRPISSVTEISGGWRIAVSSALPALDLDDVRRVCPAFLVRFEDDVVREEWLTDTVCRVPFRAVELLNETEATIS